MANSETAHVADPKLQKYLQHHNLTRLAPLLDDAGITTKDFVQLRKNPVLVAGFLPNIRDQLDFLKVLNNTTVDCGTQTDLTFSKTLGRSSKVTLTQICELTRDGQKFLRAFYKADGTKAVLTDEMRSHIRNALIEHYYPLCEGSITDPWLEQMRNIVMEELPFEDPESWYVPAKNGAPARGLLFDRYRTYRKAVIKKAKDNDASSQNNRQDHVEPPAPPAKKQRKRKHPEVRDPAPEITSTTVSSHWNDLTKDQQNVSKAAKIKLGGMGFSDEAAVRMAWEASYHVRRHEAITGELKLREWDVLNHYNDTLALITYDFNTIHGIREDTFSTKLPVFLQAFKKLHQAFIPMIDSDKELLSAVLSSFSTDDVCNDKSIFVAFYCLPFLIRQGFIKRDNRKIKPSLLDSRNAFITITETEAKITELIAERRQIAAQRNETVQPFVIAVGTVTNVESIFVTFDELLIKSRSVSAAVDLFFKIHAVFHLVYAKECESVIKFLQIYFYDIKYPQDKLESRVRTFISDLNHHA